MSNILACFTKRLNEEWLPDFCSHRNHSTQGFSSASIAKLTEHDAYWFMRTIDEKLVEIDRGCFTVTRSAANEQIFWEGKRSCDPRPITLWIEPVITIGTVGRLHNEFGWPIDKLGMQSKTWAFDLVGYDVAGNERLACEVKKDRREIDLMMAHIQEYSAIGKLDTEPTNPKARNAYRKVKGIRRSWPTWFWALGPAGYGGVWRIDRISNTETFALVPSTETELRHHDA